MNDHGEGMQLVIGVVLILWEVFVVMVVAYVLAQLARAYREFTGQRPKRPTDGAE